MSVLLFVNSQCGFDVLFSIFSKFSIKYLLISIDFGFNEIDGDPIFADEKAFGERGFVSFKERLSPSLRALIRPFELYFLDSAPIHLGKYHKFVYY